MTLAQILPFIPFGSGSPTEASADGGGTETRQCPGCPQLRVAQAAIIRYPDFFGTQAGKEHHHPWRPVLFCGIKIIHVYYFAS